LGIDDFTCAVGAELPAFVRPEYGDHGEAEVGKKAETVLGRAERGGQVSGVAAERKKDGTQNDDDADLDECGPVLEVGAFARAPDVDARDDGNHDNGQD